MLASMRQGGSETYLDINWLLPAELLEECLETHDCESVVEVKKEGLTVEAEDKPKERTGKGRTKSETDRR